MSTINISSDYNSSDIINIGIRGENEVTEVVFDYKAWHQEYGDGVVSLLVKRPADDAAYPVILSDDATHHAATWSVSGIDTEYRGIGEAEFIYTVGDQIAKTVVVRTKVERDIASMDPPDPIESWGDALTALSAQVQASAEDAEAAQVAAESAQVAAETAQNKAETAQGKAEQAQGKAETAQGKAEAAQTAAELAQTLAELYGYRLSVSGDTLVIGEEE